MTLHRCWIQEWSEFDHVSGHRQASQIKSFLSRRVDRFRPPYGRCVKEFPRRGVICGSTNQQEFLNDPTGSRRFWIIPTGSRPIDIETLRRERDAIWAAAVQAYKDGAQWWLTPDEHNQSEALNLEYQQSDPWQEIIQGKLSIPTAPSQVTTEYILSEWIGLPKDRHGKQEQRRVGAIMRQLGWEHSTQRINGTPKKCWVKVCPDIGNIGNADPKSPTTTALEGVTDIGNSVTDPKPIGNTSVTDAPPIGNVVTDIGNSLKVPPQANSSTPITDVTDAPTQITLERKFKPGQMVRYTGRDPELLKQLPEPAPVTSVQIWDKTLWVQRPGGGDVTVPMADVEVVQ